MLGERLRQLCFGIGVEAELREGDVDLRQLLQRQRGLKDGLRRKRGEQWLCHGGNSVIGRSS